jgi:hypothetical protein
VGSRDHASECGASIQHSEDRIHSIQHILACACTCILYIVIHCYCILDTRYTYMKYNVVAGLPDIAIEFSVCCLLLCGGIGY